MKNQNDPTDTTITISMGMCSNDDNSTKQLTNSATKNNSIKFRCTKYDHERLVENAKYYDMSISEYIRFAAAELHLPKSLDAVELIEDIFANEADPGYMRAVQLAAREYKQDKIINAFHEEHPELFTEEQ